MNNKETLDMTGDLKIERFDYTGQLVETRNLKNLVVSTGRAYMINRMANATDGVMSHMGVSTGTTSPVVANTDLENTANAVRVALTSITATNNSTTNKLTYVGTFPAGVATLAITEAGIFNASSAGTMLCRTNFAVVNKAIGDSIIITWDINISQS